MNRVGQVRAGVAMAFGLLAQQALSQNPKHFVVLLAASPPTTQQKANLTAAENRVAQILYQAGAVTPGQPWCRFGRDYITIIESGIGPKPNEPTNASKGRWKLVEFDYARPITRPAIHLRESRFRQLFHPGQWPHGAGPSEALKAAYRIWTATHKPTQVTYLISLRQNQTHETQLDDTVRNHLDQLQSDFQTNPPNGLRSVDETYGDYRIELKLLKRGSANQTPQPIPASTANHTPKAFRSALKILASVAVLGTAAWLTRWTAFNRTRAKHFELWIPGFAKEFALPPISESEQATFRARLPRYAGEPAAHLQLPPRLIRLLFYSRAKLSWDPRIQVEGLAPAISSCPLRRMPRFVRFLWVERPQDEGKLGITVERPRMLGGNDQISISVNFLALPKPDTES